VYVDFVHSKHSFSFTFIAFCYINWYQSLDYPDLMANNENVSNHSDNEERGVQALWAAIRTHDQWFDCIERELQEIQQNITRLGLGGKRHNYYNRNYIDEMARGRLVVGHGPTPRAINSTMKELRLAHKFTPSQSSSSATRPVAAHSPPLQRQLSPTN
jgi:hypothetical protein